MSKSGIHYSFLGKQRQILQVRSVVFFILFLTDVKVLLNISVLVENISNKNVHLQNTEHTLDTESGFKDQYFMLYWYVYVHVALLSLLLICPVYILLSGISVYFVAISDCQM